MDILLKFIDEGESLGLHGKELHDFVKAQQERERASRALEIEIARGNYERERLLARENDERVRKRSEEKGEFEVKMQLLEEQIELERMKANNNNRNAS